MSKAKNPRALQRRFQLVAASAMVALGTAASTAEAWPAPTEGGGSPLWITEGAQAGAKYGDAVVAGGDVNGDGFSDVVVAAHSFDNGQTNEGRVFVYHGSPTGPSTTANWVAESDQASAFFGTSASAAGDVNADGYNDLLIGAPTFDNGQSNEGRAFLYLGSPSGLLTAPSWTAEINQANARFGTSVAWAGDVNGDGYADVIIGAIDANNGQSGEGRAFVYAGGPSGLASSPLWTGESNNVGAEYGCSVAAAGDVNADGYGDVVVGARSFDGGQAAEGKLFVYFGSATGPAPSASWTYESNTVGAQLGFSVATAGDVNLDGYADLLAGAPFDDALAADGGSAFCWHGSAAGPVTPSNWTIAGTVAGQSLGFSVATAGDYDGNGSADAVVGSPGNTTGAAGAIRVYVAGPSGLTYTPVLEEFGAASSQLGNSVATAGDVDGDGFSDIVAGAWLYDGGQTDEGQATIWAGRGLIAIQEGFSGVCLELPCGSAGDVNGDGRDDVFSLRCGGGAFEIRHGRSLGISPVANTSIAVTASGPSADGVGDTDGDGYSDFVVADHHALGDRGEVRVHRGSSGGVITTPSLVIQGQSAGDHFGVHVADAGDYNGDGFHDLLVAGSNRIDCFLGSISGLRSDPAWSFPVIGSLWRVASAGDVNGDGLGDVLAYHEVWFDTWSNPVLIHGREDASPDQVDWTLSDLGAGDAILPGNMTSSGDVNGDGYGDLLVCVAKNYNTGIPADLRVYYGSAQGLSTSPDFSFMLGEGGPYWYCSARGLDVDHDGRSELVTCSTHTTDHQTTYAVVSPGDGSVWEAGPFETSEALVPFINAGDIHGDGYAEVVTELGTIGLRSALRDPLAQQRRSDGSEIDVAGVSDDPAQIRLHASGSSPAGRSKTRIEWQNEPLLSDLSTATIGRGPWVLTDAPAGIQGTASLTETVGGLQPETAYHWRLRIGSDSPFFPHTPWFHPARAAESLVHYRTPCIEPALGHVRGVVWDDANDDCAHDVGEAYLAGHPVLLEPDGLIATTDAAGRYDFNSVPPGDHDLTLIYPGGWTGTCPSLGTTPITVPSVCTTPNIVEDFGAIRMPNWIDLSLGLAADQVKPGVATEVSVYIRNDELPAANVTAQFDYPTAGADFVSANYGGVHGPDGRVTWNLGTLGAREVRPLTVRLLIAPDLPIGSSFTVTGHVATTSVDSDPSNNTDTESYVVVNSWDPNDKAVVPDGTISVGTKLTYTIRFENVGTADEARAVTILDTLDTDLDIATFELVSLIYTPDEFFISGRTLRVFWEDLGLSPSGGDPADSQAQMVFTIRTRPGLAPGTQITNKAEITFDANPPIETNTTLNVIAGAAGVDAAHIPNVFQLESVSPNPATGPVSLLWAIPRAGGLAVSILDVQGREIRRFASSIVTPGGSHVVWDRRDSQGHPVGVGVYFVRGRLSAPGRPVESGRGSVHLLE